MDAFKTTIMIPAVDFRVLRSVGTNVSAVCQAALAREALRIKSGVINLDIPETQERER